MVCIIKVFWWFGDVLYGFRGGGLFCLYLSVELGGCEGFIKVWFIWLYSCGVVVF